MFDEYGHTKILNSSRLAYIEMQLITATLFSNYDINLRSDGFQTIEGFVNKALALNVQLTLRQK